MAIEKTVNREITNTYLKKGLLGITTGILAISAGLSWYGELIPNNSQLYNQKSPKYYEQNYNTSNSQNIEIIKTGEKAANLFFDYGVPICLVIGGTIGGGWGVKQLYKSQQSKK